MSHKVDHQVHQLMAITLSKPNRFSILSLLETGVNCKHNRITHPTTLKVCRCTTCGKLQFKFVQITNVMFDETKHIVSHGSADNVVVKFTTVARNVHTLEDAYVTRPLVNCIVNDALVSGPCRAITSMKRFFSSSTLCSCD